MQPPTSVNHRARLLKALRQFTWGGDWAIALPEQIKHNLTWFFSDGVFASASDNIAITYLTLFILALGATRTQIGLMSSFSSLVAALMLLPGALLVERFGHRKEITLFAGGGASRLALLIFAFLPLLLKGEILVWAAIALSVTRDAFGNLSFPAWMSITADVVPLEGRGRYFGARNFVMGITGMAAILLVGEIITRAGQPLGYQLALGLAFIIGMASTLSFSRLKEPPANEAVQEGQRFSLRLVLADVKNHPAFVALTLVMMVWNFALNISGPFFGVFMVQNLKFTATMVGIASIVTTVTSLMIQRRTGKLADNWGPRKVELVCLLIIPIFPLAWVFVTQFWHVLVINIFSGIVWGMFNLVSFNFLLTLIPPTQRARYSALYQILITLSLAGGAAVGAWVVNVWGFHGVFITSAIGRAIGAILFLRFVPEILPKRPAIDTTVTD